MSDEDPRSRATEISRMREKPARAHHLNGHKYAIDAAFAVITRNAPRPVTVLTSDPEDLTLLCGPSAEVIKV